MPEDAIATDPMSYRYFDYPMTGSIFRLPDIPMLVRGRTYVKLPSGRDIEVDPQFRKDEPVPAMMHEHKQAGNSLQELLKSLTGKKTSGPPPGSRPVVSLTTTAKRQCYMPTRVPDRRLMGRTSSNFKAKTVPLTSLVSDWRGSSQRL